MFIALLLPLTWISGVKNWMIENKLQLNDDKTEYLLIHPMKCTQTFNRTFLLAGYGVTSFSTTAKNIGFYFRDHKRIDAHVQDICRKANIDTQHISSMRHLSIDATKTLVSAFVPPKLDYGNSLSNVAQYIYWKDFRMFKTQQHD